MKLLSIITMAAAAYAISNQDACSKKSKGKGTVKAIQDLCAKTNMVVPSSYAEKGHNHGGMHVQITGNCSPAQWVPQYWCLEHFYYMCATSSDDKGMGSKKYGRNDCQTWSIGGNVFTNV